MASVLVTRTLFLRHADSELFRRPVVVLGTGVRGPDRRPRPARRALVPRQGLRPCLRRSAPRHGRAARSRPHRGRVCARARYAREVGAREIVVATDERRGMPVVQLLHCKIAGINVVDYLTFWERETRKVDLEALQPSWLIYLRRLPPGPAHRRDEARRFDVVVALALPGLRAAGHAGVPRSPCGSRTAARCSIARSASARGGSIFTPVKFRSMRDDAERDGEPQWAAKQRSARDPRRRDHPPVPHRRAAAALQRAERRHELRRPAAGAAVLRRRSSPRACRSIASGIR